MLWISTQTCFNALEIFDKKTSGGAPSLQKKSAVKKWKYLKQVIS